MIKRGFALFCLFWLSSHAFAKKAANTLPFVTMNCYWFFTADESLGKGSLPQNEAEYDQKAGHLIGLLPDDAPFFIALQEIGGGKDVEKLAHAAQARYGREYLPLFIQGHDTVTGQDVGALFDSSRGWGVQGKPARVSELERHVSKHLVVRLTNGPAHLDVCVVHLRVPRDGISQEKQMGQNEALLKWSMRHLADDPRANVMILGDFNEQKPAGSKEQSLAPLFKAVPPFVDPFDQLKGKIATHAAGMALDRILISDAIFRGTSKLRFADVEIRKHSHGKGDDRRLYTDHFPVVVRLEQKAIRKKRASKKTALFENAPRGELALMPQTFSWDCGEALN